MITAESPIDQSTKTKSLSHLKKKFLQSFSLPHSKVLEEDDATVD